MQICIEDIQRLNTAFSFSRKNRYTYSENLQNFTKQLIKTEKFNKTYSSMGSTLWRAICRVFSGRLRRGKEATTITRAEKKMRNRCLESGTSQNCIIRVVLLLCTCQLFGRGIARGQVHLRYSLLEYCRERIV